MPNKKLPDENCFFAENIKQLRLSVNLTQEYIADRIGVGRTTYTKWELGKTEPSFCFLSQLIKIFNEAGEEVDYNRLFRKPH